MKLQNVFYNVNNISHIHIQQYFSLWIYDPNKLCNVHDVLHAVTTNRIINPVYIYSKFDQPSTNILYPTKILKNRS